MSLRRVLPAGLILLFILGAIARPLESARRDGAQPTGNHEFAAFEARLAALEAENEMLRADLAALEGVPAAVRGNGLLELYPVPTEAMLCDEVVPLDRADVHQRFEEEWARYLVNQHWLIKWTRRSRDVFPYIETQLAAAGMPDDLKYVLIVESGLESRAYSSAGAAGWWQFIHSTGKRYGLTRNDVVDERRDLGLATGAAIAYFTKLYDEFQSWPLALSAYNAGEKRVRDEIKEQGESDFYDLSLPRETEAYWFKAAALKILMENPEKYGLRIPADPWVATVCDTVQLKVTHQRVALREVAAGAGISYREFRELNPAFRNSWIPRGTHRVVVPATGVDALGTGVNGVTVAGRQSAPVMETVQSDMVAEPTEEAEDLDGTPVEGLDPAPEQ